MAARRSELCSWRGYEAMVLLALDMGELREAEGLVEENERRVEALKQELRELGAGSGTDESEGEGEDEPSSYQADLDFARLCLATQRRQR
jgi:hypothetical protein